MKLIFIDVETTGIPCPESGLVQLAGVIEIDGEEKERFDFRMRPFPNDKISDEALSVNGITREELEKFTDPDAVFKGLITLVDEYVDRYDRSDKFHIVGYNAQFDTNHLRAWFEKNGERYFGSWFWHPSLDVMGFAAIALMRRRATLPDFRLATVAKALGLEVDEEMTHDGLYDAELARDAFHVLMERVRKNI